MHRGPIEGRGDGGPPVHDHRVVLLVLDVPAAHVPARSTLLVDAAEEVAGARLGQVLEGVGDDHLDVLLRDLVRGAVACSDRPQAPDHRLPAEMGVDEVPPLVGEIGEELGHRAEQSARPPWRL